jgi:hypothetical protein
VNDFLQTALTFPTVIYSVLLCVCALYWVLAATGVAGDALGGDGGDVGDTGGAAAMLNTLGLSGVPVMVVATVLSFTGWVATYYLHLLVLRHLPDGVRVLAGIGVMLAVLVPAAAATSLVLRPVRRALTRLRPGEPPLLGRSAVVITPIMTGEYGQASVDDGGAGLVLQVRHEDPTPLQRGDRIVLIEYLEGQNAYRVVPEQQFLSR